MSQIQRLALALVLLPVGFMAGTDVFEMMGNMPAVKRMSLPAHVSSWQALDYFMEPRMPVFVCIMFVLFLFAIYCFRKQRGVIFWTLIACLGMELAASIFTVTQQIPVNRAVAALDPARLDDLAAVDQLRAATLRHFNLLSLLCISAFIWLLFCSRRHFETNLSPSSLNCVFTIRPEYSEKFMQNGLSETPFNPQAG